jgi:hypothetical protein
MYFHGFRGWFGQKSVYQNSVNIGTRLREHWSCARQTWGDFIKSGRRRQEANFGEFGMDASGGGC